ncbi:MAG: enoyl-CoA hydratase/isomerase family protein, partial [Burkholderiaceae bacterium]|nr:enoyl-CoA hydratase/isomerase family protein [Burkholderiaceae bacterium]
TDAVMRALGAAISEFEDDGSTRAIVLRAEGDVFCDGFDVGARPAGPQSKRTRGDFATHAALVGDTLWRIWRTPLPVVAAVQGRCLAGAVYLTAVCDFMLTTPSAQIGMSELKLGMSPPLFNILPWMMSYRAAKEFLYLGEVVDGAKAVQIGLATRCVAEPALDDEALALAHKLAAMPERVVAQMKRSVNRRWELAGVVSGVQHDLSRFVDDKAAMSDFQRRVRERLLGAGGEAALDELGIDLQLRGVRNPWA